MDQPLTRRAAPLKLNLTPIAPPPHIRLSRLSQFTDIPANKSTEPHSTRVPMPISYMATRLPDMERQVTTLEHPLPMLDIISTD